MASSAFGLRAKAPDGLDEELSSVATPPDSPLSALAPPDLIGRLWLGSDYTAETSAELRKGEVAWQGGIPSARMKRGDM